MESNQDFLSILERVKQMSQCPEDLDLRTLETLYQVLEGLAKKTLENLDYLPYKMEICQQLDRLLDVIIDFQETAVHHPCGVYTPSTQKFRPWKNVELLKDKGVVGYALANIIGGHPVMFYGSKEEHYSYLSLLPDLEFHIYPEEIGIEAHRSFLKAHYTKMDVLILHGLYPRTMDFLNMYRILRPDGKVYCGLDMNRIWAERILWQNQDCIDFASRCNMIATSSTGMRDALNQRPDVPFCCRYLSNSFYQAQENCSVVADAKRKENIILTVGRIGTHQKNNGELLRAFARALPQIPDWSLHLVGSVEVAFQEELSQIKEEYPDLESHLKLIGAISDKQSLYDQYAKAKIFALSSNLEGGSPNVYAEALVHGCQFITSSVDACEDMTNHGTLGLVYPIGDEDALVDGIISLCGKSTQTHMAEHIPKALAYAQRQYSWERNGKKLAYCLFSDR